MDDWLFQDQPFPSTPSQMAPVKPTPRQRGPSQNSYETCQHLYGPSQMHLYDTVKDPLMSSLSMGDNDDNVFASLQGDPPVTNIHPLNTYPLITSLTHPSIVNDNVNDYDG